MVNASLVLPMVSKIAISSFSSRIYTRYSLIAQFRGTVSLSSSTRLKAMMIRFFLRQFSLCNKGIFIKLYTDYQIWNSNIFNTKMPHFSWKLKYLKLKSQK